MLNLPAHVQTAAAVRLLYRLCSGVNRLFSTDYLDGLFGSRLCSAAGIGAARPERHGQWDGAALFCRKPQKATDIQTCTHTYIPTDIHRYTYTHIYLYIHSHIHRYIHRYIHTSLFWGYLGGLLGRFGAVLGASWCVPGPLWGPLGPSWGDLGGLLCRFGPPEAWEVVHPKIINIRRI